MNASKYPFLPYLVAVTTSSAEIVPAQAWRKTVTFRNVGSYDVYVAGFTGVTNTAGAKPGMPVKAGETLQLRLVDGDSIEGAFYAIADTGISNVMVVVT